MNRRWLHTLAAFTIPPLVGVGFWVAFVQALKNPDWFQQALKRGVVVESREPSLGAANAAEIRASLPMEKRYEPPANPAPSLSPVKDAMKRSEAGKPAEKPISPPASSESAAPAPPIVHIPAKKAPLPPLRSWRPILDPVAEHWSSLWPRTDALPAMFQAVLYRDAEQIARLASMGVPVDSKTIFGDTALCAAARTGQADCIRVLALAGADLNLPGRENQAPILIASMRRNTDVLASLTAFGVDPNSRFKTPVSRELIDRCLIKDLRNALESDRGVTPLICCSARGDVEGAVALMRAGAKASTSTTRYHRYPINFAATQGYLFLMRVILGRDPDSEPDTLVTIDLSSQRAWVTKQGKVIASTSVSTGREGYRTPAGRYVITDKHRSHTSTLYHVAMPWFMRLNCSAIGLHSGYVTGRPASHGCIRLPYEKAKLFFGLTDVGDEVEIVH